MKDTRFWEPLVNQPVHASPVETRQLAASDEHPMPAFGDLGPECHERSTVRRHRVVIEVAAHDIPKPLPLNRDRLVHGPRISSLTIRSFASMRSRRLFRLTWNLPAWVLPQMKVKPRKLKVSGLPSPRRLRRSAAKRPNSMIRVFSG